MQRSAPHRPLLAALLPIMLAVSGCASISPDDTLALARSHLPESSGRPLLLRQQEAQRQEALRAVDALLELPVDALGVQRLHLLGSPSLQALLADAWAFDLATEAAARPANPQWLWEHLRHGRDPEITRTFSLNLTDWLLWPARARIADRTIEAQRLWLTQQVLAQTLAVRQQWVRAVAARQMALYRQQVLSSANPLAAVPATLQDARNLARLTQSRMQAAQAQQAEVSEREALIRLLGLRGDQAQRLQLPDHLPDLPESPRDAESVSAAAVPGLDVAIAQHEVAAQLAQGPLAVAQFQVDAAAKDDKTRSGSAKGFALGIRPPLIDMGSSARSELEARQLAALNHLYQTQVEASSVLRERYGIYSSAWAVARQATTSLAPLLQALNTSLRRQADGPAATAFETLADARALENAGALSVDALRNFWLADAALRAAIDGVPLHLSPHPAARHMALPGTP